jgi:hypothetical protein
MRVARIAVQQGWLGKNRTCCAGRVRIGPFELWPARTILRKEVIQPQVLLRLPCYDLVPVAEFTVGVALPPYGGLGKRLRVLPVPVA